MPVSLMHSIMAPCQKSGGNKTGEEAGKRAFAEKGHLLGCQMVCRSLCGLALHNRASMVGMQFWGRDICCRCISTQQAWANSVAFPALACWVATSQQHIDATICSVGAAFAVSGGPEGFPTRIKLLCRSCCPGPNLWSQQQLWPWQPQGLWCLLLLLAMEH